MTRPAAHLVIAIYRSDEALPHALYQRRLQGAAPYMMASDALLLVVSPYSLQFSKRGTYRRQRQKMK